MLATGWRAQHYDAYYVEPRDYKRPAVVGQSWTVKNILAPNANGIPFEKQVLCPIILDSFFPFTVLLLLPNLSTAF